MSFRTGFFGKTLIVISILLVSALISSNPALAQIQYQYPTLSVNPSNVVMYTPATTVNVALTQVTGLNALHFIFTYNDQGSTFLSINNATTDIALGNLFAGTSATLTTNVYYLTSTGRSYIEAIVEMPGNTGVSSTSTKTVLSITLHLLPTAIAGLQSNLKLEEADALFTDSQYIDEAGGLVLQSGALTVGYLTTSITATSLTATAGSAVTLTSTLHDSQGNPLSGFGINYYIGSQNVGAATTDASGLSSISYTPTTAGTYTINAMYVGNQTGGTFASSSATATLTVNPQNIPPTTKATTLALNLPQSVMTGVATTIQATLTQGTSPLPSESVIFSATPSGGSAISLGSATTNSNGVASISYTFSTSTSYSVTAKFLGDTTNQPSSASGSLSVSQNSLIATALTLNVPSTAKVNQQIKISSTLVDSNQQPISGETITYISVDASGAKQTIGSASTDAKGATSVPYVPTAAQTYQIQANYAGSSTYSASEASQPLSVNALIGNKTTTTLTLALSTANVNTQTFVTLSATLADQTGGPLAEESIVYQFSPDGITWTNITTVATGNDGIAQTNYKPDQTGSLTIRAVFNGDANYYSIASNQKTLSVSNGATNSSIPWLWIGIIAVIALIIVVVAAIVMTKRRQPMKSKGKPKPNPSS
jgi:hypothetical protein